MDGVECYFDIMYLYCVGLYCVLVYTIMIPSYFVSRRFVVVIGLVLLLVIQVLNMYNFGVSYVNPSISLSINSYRLPSIDVDKLIVMSQMPYGTITGRLISIESPSDIEGLRVFGSGIVDYSVSLIPSEYSSIPGFGVKALRVEGAPASTIYLKYDVPGWLVSEVLAGSRIHALASILPVDGSVSAGISIVYDGGGGCPSILIDGGDGGVYIVDGRGSLLLSSVKSVSLVERGDTVSRLESLEFYRVPVEQGKVLALYDGGVALVDEDKIRVYGRGPLSHILSPGGLMYPLLPGQELSFRVSGGNALVVKLVDVKSRYMDLQGYVADGTPLVKGFLEVHVDGRTYTIGPRLPLDGTYLFPVHGSGGSVVISNPSNHPIGIDMVGVVLLDYVEMVPWNRLEKISVLNSSVSGFVLGKGSSVNISVNSGGPILLKYSIEAIKRGPIEVAASPELSLSPDIGGWATIDTGIVDIPSYSASVKIVIRLESSTGFTAYIDGILAGYMPVSQVIVGSFYDPDDTWCPTSLPGINCIDFYWANLSYTAIASAEIIHADYFQYRSYESLSLKYIVSYIVVADGVASNGDDLTEPDDPVISVDIGVKSSPQEYNYIIVNDGSIMFSNDKNVEGTPGSYQASSNGFDTISLAASTISLVLGAAALVVSGPTAAFLGLMSSTTGAISLVFGYADYTSPPTATIGSYYQSAVVRDYDQDNGVNNATLTFILTHEIDLNRIDNLQLIIDYYNPPGLSYWPSLDNGIYTNMYRLIIPISRS